LRNFQAPRTDSPLAECNSALQQIENLRYEVPGQVSRRARILTNSSTKRIAGMNSVMMKNLFAAESRPSRFIVHFL